jgi:hypothetical protein
VITRNAVQKAFDRFGRAAGFEKKSGAWYRRCDEVVAVVDLQKSQYGPQYYVNAAFWLRALGEEQYPKTWKSHVQVRLGALLTPELAERAKRLLDLDQEIPDEQRTEELAELLSESVVPVLKRGCSLVARAGGHPPQGQPHRGLWGPTAPGAPAPRGPAGQSDRAE